MRTVTSVRHHPSAVARLRCLASPRSRHVLRQCKQRRSCCARQGADIKFQCVLWRLRPKCSAAFLLSSVDNRVPAAPGLHIDGASVQVVWLLPFYCDFYSLGRILAATWWARRVIIATARPRSVVRESE